MNKELSKLNGSRNTILLLFVLLSAQACSNHLAPYAKANPSRAAPTACGQPKSSTVRNRLILIGDSGAPLVNGKTPVLATLVREAKRYPQKSIVLLLGDIVYGGPINSADPESRRRAALHLKLQLEALRQAAVPAIFIPGNHDWDGGIEGLRMLGDAINQYATNSPLASDLLLSPQPHGCPGPVKFDFPGFRLIVLDTTLLRRFASGKPPPVVCQQNGLQSVIGLLKEFLVTEKPVVLAGHHALKTYGPHGQFYDWNDHLFPLRQGGWSDILWLPLPGIGSLYPLLHATLGCAMDACGPLERQLQFELRKALADRPPLIYAAGHDHSLQVLEGKPFATLLLISGAGSPTLVNEVARGRETLFAQSAPGFMTVDFLEQENVFIRVFSGLAGEEVFSLCETYSTHVN